MQLYAKNFRLYLLLWVVLFCLVTGGMTVQTFKHDPYNFLLVGFMVAIWFTPGLIADLIRARRCWSDMRLRYLGVPMLGGAVAVSLGCYSSIFGVGKSFYGQWAGWAYKIGSICPLERLDDFNRMVVQLNLLDKASRFVDTVPQLLAIGAMTAMIMIYVFDTIRERWMLRSFLIGYCLAAVPSLAGVTSYVTETRRPDLLLWLIPIGLLCMVPGVLGILFACTVRANWWESYFPWLS